MVGSLLVALAAAAQPTNGTASRRQLQAFSCASARAPPSPGPTLAA